MTPKKKQSIRLEKQLMNLKGSENELISSDITVKGFIDQYWKDWRSTQLVHPDHFHYLKD